MIPDPTDELVQELLAKILRPLGSDPRSTTQPDETTVEFVTAAAVFLRSVDALLPHVPEAVRFALASRVHPEGTDEQRHISRNSITKLPDKASFVKLLPTFEENTGYVIVSMDANGLNLVNNELGHHFGDAYLIAIATALEAASDPACDNGIRIFHLSGDEFAAFVPEELTTEFVSNFKQAFTHNIRRRYIQDGRTNVEGKPKTVPSTMIRRLLGKRLGVSMGLGRTEVDAEAMLRVDKQSTRP